MDAVVPIHSEFKGAYVSRSSRCSYLGLCLCGDGTLLPPMCICENEEIKRGLELFNEQEVLYKGNSRMNCSTELLNEYINEIFLPELIKRKEHMKYEGNTLLFVPLFYYQYFENHKIPNLLIVCVDDYLCKYLIPINPLIDQIVFSLVTSNNLRDVISKNSFEQLLLLKHVFNSFELCKEKNTLCSLFIKNNEFISEQYITNYVKKTINEINSTVTLSRLNNKGEMINKSIPLSTFPFILRKPFYQLLNFDEFKNLKTIREKRIL